MSESDHPEMIRFLAGERNLKVPFEFNFIDADEERRLLCKEVLRLLPSKRLVCVAEIDGETVICKLFVGPAADRDWQRERDGLSAMAEAGIVTPEVLGSGMTGFSGKVLLLEYLGDAELLSLRLKGKHDSLVEEAVRQLARLHRSGSVQTDAHLDNFMVRGGVLTMIDGGGVRTAGGIAGDTRRNLASFIARLHWVRSPSDIAPLLHCYEAIAGVQPRADTKQLWADVTGARDRARQSYQRKIFRDCSEFHCVRRPGSLVICRRDFLSTSMHELLADPDAVMTSSQILKSGNSATVVALRLDGRDLVIKRNNMKNPGHLLRRLPRRSRGYRAWYNAHLLKQFEITAAVPVALVEHRLLGFSTTTYFVAEKVAGLDCRDYFSERGEDADGIRAVAALLKKMWRSSITHGDLKYTNIIMTAAGPVLIDIDGIRVHRSASRRNSAVIRDRHRFLDNWNSMPRLQQAFTNALE